MSWYNKPISFSLLVTSIRVQQSRVAYQGRLLAMLTNVELGQQQLANDQAYCIRGIDYDRKKCLKVQPPGANPIKTFTAVITIFEIS
jgi:hypothetical protein